MLSKAEVKYIQSLSQKKYRQQENLFIAEGPKIIEELLNGAAHSIKKIFATKDWVDANETHRKRTEIITVDEKNLERISQLKTPNHVVAVIEILKNKEIGLQTEGIVLALDSIQDPGNMGTIVRIADWFGIKQIICSEDCADVYNSKVVQSSMGSIFRTEVYYTNLPQWLQQQSATVYGAALDGKALKFFKKTERAVLLIGNESKGIRPEAMQYVQQKITIEKIGGAESLNAAVATGIILSHIV